MSDKVYKRGGLSNLLISNYPIVSIVYVEPEKKGRERTSARTT
jgi:hypothetical protein